MKTEILQALEKSRKLIRKDNFENLFRLMVDYQLTPMFGKKGFRLKEHIDHIIDFIITGGKDRYIDYIRHNMLTVEEPDKYLIATQLILSSVERYLWFWLEDNHPAELLKNLIDISGAFNSFRDQLAFARFKNDLKLEPHVEKESAQLLEDKRFFLYKKTREIKDYFESVLESTTDAVISTDASGRIILFNRGASAMFGYEPEEVFHKQTGFLYAKPEDAEGLKNELIKSGGMVHSYETEMLTKEGEKIPVLISASMVKNRAGTVTGIVRFIKNIARIKELENELRRLSEFKSKYLHDISHEIKTPITTIIGFIDIIHKYYDQTLDINVKRYMDKTRDSCNVLVDLMDTLLDLSMIDAGKLELKYSQFNPRDLLEDVKVIFLPQISEKGIDFSTNCKQDINNITADRARLRQIIFNLVSNAVKFTPERGKVTLKIDSNGGRLVITVTDTGKGIPPEKQQKIFDEFERLSDADTKGAGLGLSLAKKLTGLHKGTISLQSQIGAGSKFIVEIPLQPEQLQPKEQPAPVPQGKK